MTSDNTNAGAPPLLLQQPKVGHFSDAFYGLGPRDIPNLNVLLGSDATATDRFSPADEVAPTASPEIRKLQNAVESIFSDLNFEVVGCELSIIANENLLEENQNLFFSTYLWSPLDSSVFVDGYSRAMNSMVRVQLGSSPIVTHPDFDAKDIAFIAVPPRAPPSEPIPSEEAVVPAADLSVHVRRFTVTPTTRETNLSDRVAEFREALLSALREAGSSAAFKLVEVFASANLLVIPLFRQTSPEGMLTTSSQRGELAGVLFAFYRPRAPRSGERDVEQLTRRLSWLFAEGFARESQAVFGRIAEHRDVIYNMIHTTVNALNAMNVQAISEFLLERTFSPDRSQDSHILRHKLVDRRTGIEISENHQKGLAAQIRTAHQLQSMSAALLSITEMSFHPGLLRQKFQADATSSVLEVLDECLFGVNSNVSVRRVIRPPVRLIPSLHDPETVSSYENWFFSKGYVHHSIVWQVIFELLGNARHFGQDTDGWIDVFFSMSIEREGDDELFTLRLRNKQAAGKPVASAPTGLASLSYSFLGRASSFLEATKIGKLFVSPLTDGDFEATLVLKSVMVEPSATHNGACRVAPVEVISR